jgi:predicted dehydrogenase
MAAIQLGIIGAGIITHDTHVPILDRLKRKFRVVAIADVVRASAERVAANLGGRADVMEDYRSLLDRHDIEAVLIAVPPYLTADITIDALRAGKHVLGEKPMANTVEEARKILRVWRKTDCTYMVAEQFFFIPAYQRLREMARTGDWPFGKPRMVELHQYWKMCPHTITKYYHSAWRHDKRLTWGYLLEGGCHTANPIREAFGMPRKIQSRLLSVDKALGRWDTIIANCELSSGTVCQLTMAYGFRTQAKPILELFAKDGTITLENGTSGLKFIAENGEEWTETMPEDTDCYERQWHHFHEVLAKGKALELTPEQTRDDLVFVQRLIDAAL